MNLDLSWLGWLHAAASLLALGLGPAAFFQRKGSPAHVAFGRAYLVVMLAVNLTAFGIYRRHIFWFPHWFAVTALVAIAVAYAAVRLKRPRGAWLRLHLTGMLASYYVLIGGGVNEVYLRVDALRPLATARNIGMTHSLVILAFIVLIAAVNATVASPRRHPAAAAA